MRNEKRGTRNVGKNPRADFIIKTAGVRGTPSKPPPYKHAESFAKAMAIITKSLIEARNCINKAE